MDLIQAPAPLPRAFIDKPSFFLSGAIVPWRESIIKTLEPYNCTVLNPERKDWIKDWWSDSGGDPRFKEQIEWELTAQERCHFNLMYLASNAQCPIALLELGLFTMGGGGELIVYCEPGFWRKGNVDFVIGRYEIDSVDSLSGLTQRAIEEVKNWERRHPGSIERRLNR